MSKKASLPFSAAVEGKKQSVCNSDVWLVEKQWHSLLFDEINLNNGYDVRTTANKDEYNAEHTVFPITILTDNINTSALIKYHKSNQFYLSSIKPRLFPKKGEQGLIT